MLDYRFPEPPMLVHPSPAKPLTQREVEIADINTAVSDLTSIVDQYGLQAVLNMLTAYCYQAANAETQPIHASIWRLTGQRLNVLTRDRFVHAVSGEEAVIV